MLSDGKSPLIMTIRSRKLGRSGLLVLCGVNADTLHPSTHLPFTIQTKVVELKPKTTGVL